MSGLLPADFGFAQHMSPRDEKHVLRGSPLYMAPEMVCQRQYDARVDLWSMGVILYGETFVPLLSTLLTLYLGKASLGPSWVLMRIGGSRALVRGILVPFPGLSEARLNPVSFQPPLCLLPQKPSLDSLLLPPDRSQS